MIRGTTAQFRFNVPYDFDDFCVIEAVFWQPGNNGTPLTAPLPIIKRLESRDGQPTHNDGFLEGTNSKEICIALSSEETLRFWDDRKGYAQIRAYCDNRHVTIGSKPKSFTVYPVYNDVVIATISDEPVEDGTVVLDAGAIE